MLSELSQKGKQNEKKKSVSCRLAAERRPLGRAVPGGFPAAVGAQIPTTCSGVFLSHRFAAEAVQSPQTLLPKGSLEPTNTNGPLRVSLPPRRKTPGLQP